MGGEWRPLLGFEHSIGKGCEALGKQELILDII